MWECGLFSILPGQNTTFSFLAGVLILLVVVVITIKIFGTTKTDFPNRNQDREDSLEILKTRFAKGDINRDDYILMKDVLLKN